MLFAREFRKQLLATLSVNALTICYGVSMSWTSAGLPILESDASPLPTGKLTSTEATWVGSVVGIGGMFSNIGMCFMSDRFGRRTLLIGCAIPNLLGWIAMYLAQNVYYLYVSRVLQGACAGAMYVLAPIFVAEISDNRIRGTLGTMFSMSANIGILLGYILGHFVDFVTIPLLLSIMTSVSILAMITFLKETPSYLSRNGYIQEAEMSAQYYTNLDNKSANENGVHSGELEHLKTNRLPDPVEKSQFSLKDLATPAAREALAIGFYLLMLKQFSGMTIMVLYAGTIFDATGSSISPNVAAIVTGVVQLLGTYISAMLVDRSGRKVLLTISTLGTGMSLLTLGVYSYLRKQGTDVNAFGWLPLVTVSAMLLLGSCGILPMPFVVMSEIMPSKIRSVGTSLGMTSLWASGFLAVRTFSPMMQLIGIHNCFFVYATWTLVGTVVVNVFMFETKGKSLEEITRFMEGRKAGELTKC